MNNEIAATTVNDDLLNEDEIVKKELEAIEARDIDATNEEAPNGIISIHLPHASYYTPSESDYYKLMRAKSSDKFKILRNTQEDDNDENFDNDTNYLLNLESTGLAPYTTETPLKKRLSGEPSALQAYLQQRATKILVKRLNLNFGSSSNLTNRNIHNINLNNTRQINRLSSSIDTSTPAFPSEFYVKNHNQLVERRFTILKTMKNSNGMMSINVPVATPKLESKSPSFIVTNDGNTKEIADYRKQIAVPKLKSAHTYSASKRSDSGPSSIRPSIPMREKSQKSDPTLESRSLFDCARYGSPHKKNDLANSLKDNKSQSATNNSTDPKLSASSKKQDYRNYKKTSITHEPTFDSKEGKIITAWTNQPRPTENRNNKLPKSVNIAKVISNDTNTSYYDRTTSDYSQIAMIQTTRVPIKSNPPQSEINMNYFGIDKTNQIKITLKSRQNGTILWPKVEKTPGPGAHDHQRFTIVNPNRPNFTIPHAPKVDTNFKVGPYCIY